MIDDIMRKLQVISLYNFTPEICMQGSAPISGLSETSSDSEDFEKAVVDKCDSMDISKMERVFITGVLDELKIRFNYNNQVCMD